MFSFSRARVGILSRYFQDLRERDALNVCLNKFSNNLMQNADIIGKQEEEILSLKSSNDTLRKQNSLLMKELETFRALSARSEQIEVCILCTDCFKGLLGAVNGTFTGRAGERIDETYSSGKNKNVNHHGCFDSSDAFVEAAR